MKLSPRYFNKRLTIILGLFFLCIIIICARLIHLQINLTNSFFQRSQKNFMRFEKIASPRGNILDSHGALLATNRPIVAMYWQGSGNKQLTTEQESALHFIEMIAEQPIDIPAALSAERLRKKIAIIEDLSGETLSRFAEQFPNHTNITFATTFKRFYPHGTIASHLLGYLCVTYDEQGTMGLEKVLDQDLKGIPGELLRMINSTGKHLEEKTNKKKHLQAAISSPLYILKNNILQKLFFPPIMPVPLL